MTNARIAAFVLDVQTAVKDRMVLPAISKGRERRT